LRRSTMTHQAHRPHPFLTLTAACSKPKPVEKVSASLAARFTVGSAAASAARCCRCAAAPVAPSAPAPSARTAACVAASPAALLAAAEEAADGSAKSDECSKGVASVRMASAGAPPASDPAPSPALRAASCCCCCPSASTSRLRRSCKADREDALSFGNQVCGS
jgi:hypothetical protein